MKWNLRLAAANRSIWKASELQHMLAEHGLVIGAGKMSALWSGLPARVKLDELDVICVVLGCEVGELLIPTGGGYPANRLRGSVPEGRNSRPHRPDRGPQAAQPAVAAAGVTNP